MATKIDTNYELVINRHLIFVEKLLPKQGFTKWRTSGFNMENSQVTCLPFANLKLKSEFRNVYK